VLGPDGDPTFNGSASGTGHHQGWVLLAVAAAVAAVLAIALTVVERRARRPLASPTVTGR